MSRIPPHSEECERGLLGAVIFDADYALPIAVEQAIHPDSFYIAAHAAIYAAILDLAERKKPVNIITLADRLKELHGDAYPIQTLESLIDACPTASTAGYFAEQVKRKQAAREIINQCRDTAEKLYDSEDVDNVKASHELALSQICPITRQVETLAEAAAGLLARWKLPQANRPIAPRFPWEWLNKASGDLVDEVVYLAAQPSVGKTAAACNMAVYSARRGINTLLVSLESSLANISKRFISHMAGVNCLALRSGMCAESLWRRADQAVEELRKLPLTVIDQPLTDAQLTALVKRHVSKGVELVLIDNMKHIQPSQRFNSEPERFKAVSERIKWMRDEVKKPVVVLHHLTDEGKMAWSRDIARDADIIVTMAKVDDYENGPTRKVSWKIDKNRDGMAGIEHQMTFHTDTQTFEE